MNMKHQKVLMQKNSMKKRKVIMIFLKFVKLSDKTLGGVYILPRQKRGVIMYSNPKGWG